MKCGWLENRISIETDGWTRPCCLETNNIAKINHISNGGMIKSFNHPKLLELRKNLNETGFSVKTRPYCYRCESLESRNQISMRLSTSTETDNRQLNYIQFKNSNKCQLACAHCGPDRSSTWAKILNIKPHVKTGFKITEEFINELIAILPQIKVLKFSGGEPFLDPDHWKILEYIKHADRQHCEIHYITNGLSNPKVNLWEGWKSVKCSISVDGFEESYEWFRRGSNWKKLLNNIKILETLCEISINYSITPYTVGDYNRAKLYWKKYNFGGFPIVYPGHCSLFNFPINKIKQLNEWNTIPYISNYNENEDNINIFKDWAKKSDIMWNTVGWAEKLFWWMND